MARWIPNQPKVGEVLNVANNVQLIALIYFGNDKLLSMIHLIGVVGTLYESSKEKRWLALTLIFCSMESDYNQSFRSLPPFPHIVEIIQMRNGSFALRKIQIPLIAIATIITMLHA